jgi:hypothetical protein
VGQFKQQDGDPSREDFSLQPFAIWGDSHDNYGVIGSSENGIGVQAASTLGYGVRAEGGNVGVFARNTNPSFPRNDAYLASPGFAGDFQGNVSILGRINKFGGGFQIDHPFDPEKKYLSHSFVESPDMKNIYDGWIMLDANGEGVVELPAWFETLNTDFRYQLTSIGAPGPNLYIAEEIHNNRFKIAGGTSNRKVCWQVTGIRQDAWAKAHRILVEEEKPAEEQGYYLDPELHGKSEEKHVRRVRYPERMPQGK